MYISMCIYIYIYTCICGQTSVGARMCSGRPSKARKPCVFVETPFEGIHMYYRCIAMRHNIQGGNPCAFVGTRSLGSSLRHPVGSQ